MRVIKCDWFRWGALNPPSTKYIGWCTRVNLHLKHHSRIIELCGFKQNFLFNHQSISNALDGLTRSKKISSHTSYPHTHRKTSTFRDDIKAFEKIWMAFFLPMPSTVLHCRSICWGPNWDIKRTTRHCMKNTIRHCMKHTTRHCMKCTTKNYLDLPYAQVCPQLLLVNTHLHHNSAKIISNPGGKPDRTAD